MENTFVEAKSDNLPLIDSIMMAGFFGSNSNFISAEIKNVKAERSTRENYGDSAIGYVQLRRYENKCIIKGKITPEHKIKAKPYSVTIICNEADSIVESVACEGCAASQGGCKHIIAFLAWVHRRSEEPTTTSVQCYWKKAVLSILGTSKKFIKTCEMAGASVSDDEEVDSTFLQNIVNYSKDIGRMNTVLTKYYKVFPDVEKLSLHYLLANYRSSCSARSVSDFDIFCKQYMSDELCKKACTETIGQSNNPLRNELRYARVTVSSAYAVLHSKKIDGSVVEGILGASNLRDTVAMKRGRMLEETVLDVLSKQIKIKFQPCGLMLNKQCPFLGASPDSVSDEYVIEVKCPSSVNTFKKYITRDNKVSTKYLAQLQLQMFCQKKLKAIFCVANHDFEETNHVTVVYVDFDKEYCNDMVTKISDFRKKCIFPVLIK